MTPKPLLLPSGSNPTWSDTAKRVIIQTPNYLNFDASYSIGGRQRYIRDISLLIQEWGRDVLVVQKGISNFETICPSGINVIGLKSNITAKGDPFFSKKVIGFKKPGDVILYASGEDAWPYFSENSKAIQHGVWWDGPQKLYVRLLQVRRALAMMNAVKTVLCVDTNFINWLRCLGPKGYLLANKCEYIPNYADIAKIPKVKSSIDEKFSIITARRYEHKRGADLLMSALGVLRSTDLDFHAHFSTTGGVEELTGQASRLNLERYVSFSQDSMDEILSRYQNFHVAVVPTRWSEGTSLACIEALSAGLPVVCTPVGGLGNLIVPDFNGYVVPPTAERIAEALYQCANKETLVRLRAGAISLRDALSLENWKKPVLAWLKT